MFTGIPLCHQQTETIEMEKKLTKGESELGKEYNGCENLLFVAAVSINVCCARG